MFPRALAFVVIFSSILLSACSAQQNLGEETWYQVDSKNFRIITNGDPEAVKTLSRDLERYRAVALHLLGTGKSSHKLTIYAAADRQSYAGLVGDELAEMTNGLFDTTAEGSYALVNLDGRGGKRELKAREFLFHEYTHFLSYNGNTTHYPYWYSEGFAEFMSTMTFSPDGRYQLGAIPAERAMTLLYTSPMPLKQLLRATTTNTSDDDKARVYASGWMLTDWLIMQSGKVDQFKKYVKAYNNGADPVDALERTFGVKLADVQKQYEAMFQNGQFNLVSGSVPKDFHGVDPTVQQLSKRHAIAQVARFLVQSGYNLDSLHALVQYARAQGVDSPELTAAQAEAETRVGNYQHAEQLLATIPPRERNKFWYQTVDAWLGLTQQINTAKPQRDRAALKEARDKFVYLVNNDTDLASNWYGLAMSMQMLGYPRAKYMDMLEQAYLRAPRQVHIAQWLAMELYAQKDAEYFTRVAKPLLLELSSQDDYDQMKAMLKEMQPKASGKVRETTRLAQKDG
ncbi:collagenase [Microbulbifer sp. SAOS-129_SWC]|uniref:collagenase n=1 Tax=Microbulbifer sp. SAOS-129_SWC TaxID=3145235 RepID=UPI0032166305